MRDSQILNERFDSFLLPNAELKRLATGFDWVEGPVWVADADCLLFSDIPNNRIHRWNEETGISTYRYPSNYSNGHTRDKQGRLISCEHGTRRVTRTEHDGTLTVVADGFEGKRLNSPNDVVVKSDGSIWFTDPHYGIVTNYEGYKSDQELSCNVYKVDPVSGQIQLMTDVLECPNGLAFDPNEKFLYVSDTGAMFSKSSDTAIHRFDVTDNSTLKFREGFFKVDTGLSDGLRIDTEGNVWTSAGDGVHCISPNGDLLGKILVPEVVSNVCFGGRSKHRLFITATTSIYSVVLNRSGIQWP